MASIPVLVPIRNKNREVIAFAKVDRADAKMAALHSWHLNAKGYVVTDIRRLGHKGTTTAQMARLILDVEFGDKCHVDHKNRDRLDNRRRNLRILTPAQNNENVPARGPTSQYRGVCWYKAGQKWQAKVRKRHLGYFDREEDAAMAAQEFRVAHLPFSTEEGVI